MSQLLTIFNIDLEDEVCRLFLPFWWRSGCDLLFSSPLDAPSKLEGLGHVNFGRKLTGRAEDYWFYQSRVLDTFRYCLSLTQYSSFIFTQYDSICLGPLPLIPHDASIHRLACGPTPQFESRLGMHPPWCFGRTRLLEFVLAASQEPLTLEHGIMDRWLPLVMQRHNLPFTPCEWAWSANSIDTPSFVSSAAQAIDNGCLFLHGCKNMDQVNAVLDISSVGRLTYPVR